MSTTGQEAVDLTVGETPTEATETVALPDSRM
jgi:hypothetical protein